MNPKIRELADQAKMSTYLLAYGIEFNMAIERFAKLIVQECVSICKEKERPNLYGVREVEAGIKQYFGVVE